MDKAPPLSLDSNEWADCLAYGLGAQVERVGENLLAVIPAGPFRLAYADFPVGRPVYTRIDTQRLVDAARRMRADVVRLHSGKLLAWPQSASSRDLGTLCIDDLQGWSEIGLEKPRRTANRAVRSPLEIEGARESDGPVLYSLYLGTLQRHAGSRRYTAKYFSRIARRTTLVARYEGRLCAFVSFGRLHGRACYLHGGFDPALREHYASDLLFLRMLREAKESGATSFDFLPSPHESLVRYKKSWGAVPASFVVSDIVLRPVRAAALGVARRANDGISRILRGVGAS